MEIVLTGMESHAMKPVAEAYSKHSLSDFVEALNSFQEQVEQDPIVHCHLSCSMTLLEQNLHRCSHSPKLKSLTFQSLSAYPLML